MSVAYEPHLPSSTVRHLPPLSLLFLLLAGTQPVHPPAKPDSSGDAVADTLRFALASGGALVAALPGRPDAKFRVVRAPALSWLVGRSFFWQTVPAERGREFIQIVRETEGRTDTLMLVVDVGTE